MLFDLERLQILFPHSAGYSTSCGAFAKCEFKGGLTHKSHLVKRSQPSFLAHYYTNSRNNSQRLGQNIQNLS